ncbi:MAG: VLRF1 family aeRF1-type release factor [Armatimonadota bacterium]|nr:VLRF1 family aeRF1-type release factor [Armatimonadota bacterium]MDR7439190.1 VLRF1 family aeRF1-type release factor [Armatimonadota bacterium]MDR7562788.1 VLRF1 family aeRF1-type release factor [Armatimonadota bacterium]MDR7568754.1 VLRF1 family aeRF1-type release factor [Armatimonadota bacterium]MDR7600899.1 VLRF1 family aeRF1-type release factor [Armatimonadota bacterium]
MLDPQDLEALVTSPRRDVLSVCLDVDPTEPSNQRSEPAWRIWARRALHEVVENLPKEERRAAREVADRIVQYLRESRPQGRGLALFAASDLWREYSLPVPLPNFVRYGRPDVWPLLWAMDEYQPHAILIVHRDHARLLMAYLGSASLIEEESLELDTTSWRFTAGRPPTFTGRLGTGATRGVQRDTFEARVDDHLRRFWAGVAEAAARFVEERHIERLLLGGPEEAAFGVRDQLPESASRKVVAVVPLPSPLEEWPQIRGRILAVARQAERQREAERIQELVERSGQGEGVLGLEPTLEALVRRQVQLVVVDRELEVEVVECPSCGYVSGRILETCRMCGAATVRTRLTQVLPLLAHLNRAALELVNPQPMLRSRGGIGALLRYSV